MTWLGPVLEGIGVAEPTAHIGRAYAAARSGDGAPTGSLAGRTPTTPSTSSTKAFSPTATPGPGRAPAKNHISDPQNAPATTSAATPAAPGAARGRRRPARPDTGVPAATSTSTTTAGTTQYRW